MLSAAGRHDKAQRWRDVKSRIIEAELDSACERLVQIVVSSVLTFPDLLFLAVLDFLFFSRKSLPF